MMILQLGAGGMTANAWLGIFLVAFWTVVYLAVRAGNLTHGRRFSDGPSLIPTIPFFPLVFFGLGWLLNLCFAPAGTVMVILIHLGYLIYGVCCLPSTAKRK